MNACLLLRRPAVCPSCPPPKPSCPSQWRWPSCEAPARLPTPMLRCTSTGWAGGGARAAGDRCCSTCGLSSRGRCVRVCTLACVFVSVHAGVQVCVCVPLLMGGCVLSACPLIWQSVHMPGLGRLNAHPVLMHCQPCVCLHAWNCERGTAAFVSIRGTHPSSQLMLLKNRGRMQHGMKGMSATPRMQGRPSVPARALRRARRGMLMHALQPVCTLPRAVAVL